MLLCLYHKNYLKGYVTLTLVIMTMIMVVGVVTNVESRGINGKIPGLEFRRPES